MNLIGRMLVFIVLLLGVAYVVWRSGYVKLTSDCYTKLMAVYNQNGIITKQSSMTPEQYCQQNKTLILEGIQCFRKTSLPGQLFSGEISMLNGLARTIGRATHTSEETVTDHNSKCTSRRTRIVVDPNSPDPYGANFE